MQQIQWDTEIHQETDTGLMQNLTPGRPTGFRWQNSVLGRNDSVLTRQMQPNSFRWNQQAGTFQTRRAPLKWVSLQIFILDSDIFLQFVWKFWKVIVFFGNIESLGAQEEILLDYRYSTRDWKSIFVHWRNTTDLSYSPQITPCFAFNTRCR